MRILILDDEEYRHAAFAKEYEARGHETVHVYDTTSAITAMRDGQRFDFITLDHDLADYTYEAYKLPVEATGQNVADWMAMFLPKDKYPDAVRIHSWNVPGAKRMCDTLTAAEFHVFIQPYTVSTSVE